MTERLGRRYCYICGYSLHPLSSTCGRCGYSQLPKPDDGETAKKRKGLRDEMQGKLDRAKSDFRSKLKKQ
ncbi:MAG: hypothetical protein VXW22_12325 [Pseudomonadota bacterium]|jgi:hypothetical protein|nr:hypothetical protein [Pseudomonadota bacterium]